jgi:hypothetical protein
LYSKLSVLSLIFFLIFYKIKKKWGCSHPFGHLAIFAPPNFFKLKKGQYGNFGIILVELKKKMELCEGGLQKLKL